MTMLTGYAILKKDASLAPPLADLLQDYPAIDHAMVTRAGSSKDRKVSIKEFLSGHAASKPDFLWAATCMASATAKFDRTSLTSVPMVIVEKLA